MIVRGWLDRGRPSACALQVLELLTMSETHKDARKKRVLECLRGAHKRSQEEVSP